MSWPGKLSRPIVVVADRAQGPVNTVVLLALVQVLAEETERARSCWLGERRAGRGRARLGAARAPGWSQMLQNGVLMIAQGHTGVAEVSLWSLVAGSSLSALIAAWRVADGQTLIAGAGAGIGAPSRAARSAGEVVAAVPAVASARPRGGALPLPPAERPFVGARAAGGRNRRGW